MSAGGALAAAEGGMASSVDRGVKDPRDSLARLGFGQGEEIFSWPLLRRKEVSERSPEDQNLT